MPTRRKGKNYSVEISGVAWLDLLGYGSMLRAVSFDPTHAEAHAAVHRLKRFQTTATSFACPQLQALIVNDGVAYVRQLSPRSNSVSYDFLSRVFEAFSAINHAEFLNGEPGARMIVAVGPRLKIPGVGKPRTTHLQSIVERYASGRITGEQAISEAFHSTPVTGSIPELQANFAFTKAYLADQAGSKAGLAGPHCFVDSVLLSSEAPNWIQSDAKVEWKTEGLEGTFLRVTGIDRGEAGRDRLKGVRNALEISCILGIAY
jgi:hypothetical protein